MTRPVMIGAAVLLIAVGGGAAYFVITADEDDSNSQNTSQSTDNQSSENQFAPASTEGLEFKATITTTGGGTAGTSTIEHDDQGNTRYTASRSGQQTEIIYTMDAYYMCTADNCIKYPISQSSNSGFNPSDYTYDESKISGYRSGSTYQGQQSCPGGTCDVWSVSSGGVSSTIFIDADSKRIVQVEGSVGGVTSRTVYEYVDVTISIPEDAQEINLPQ